MPCLKTVLALFATLSLANAHAAGPTGLLNDTGQTSCYDASDAAVACVAGGVGSDTDTLPRQDGRFGRDHAGMAKIGGGAAGFDFTRVCMSGQLAGSGACPASPAQGTNPNEWACTKDNVTNLYWSIQSFAGKTWTQATDTGAGSPINDHNTASRCGFNTGWRVPNRRELVSIVLTKDVSPAIDTAYFPGTASDYYWTSVADAASATKAWLVLFLNSAVSPTFPKSDLYPVRLVHDGL